MLWDTKVDFRKALLIKYSLSSFIITKLYFATQYMLTMYVFSDASITS